MNERILLLRKALKLTQKEFASKIGVKHGIISAIELNKALVTERTIISLCATFNVNETWLRTGQGEMFNDSKILIYDEFFSIFNSLDPILQDFLINTAKNLLDAQNKLKKM